MPGEYVPLVLLPRFTTLVGNQAFMTVGMDVTDYSSAVVNVWRGNIVGATTPSATYFFEESTDQVTWSTCAGTSGSGETPSTNTETQYTATLTKRWFRIRVVLGGADNSVSCWAVGFLVDRLS